MLSPLAICAAHVAEGEPAETGSRPGKKKTHGRALSPKTAPAGVHHVAASLPLPPLSIRDLVNTPKAYQKAVYQGGAPKLPRTI